MWKILTMLAAGLVGLALVLGLKDDPVPRKERTEHVYTGAADASAVEFIDATTLAVVDDEDNVLRFYEAGTGGAPRFTLDLSAFLDLEPDEESDLEGAARIGDRIYWLTSHGRNRKGKDRSARGRFFATEIVRSEGGAKLRPVGRPFRDLIPLLVQALEAQGIPLASAAGIDAAGRTTREDERLAPKVGGLNLEGLAACPDGTCLYLGLRNPLHEVGGVRHAIIVPLLNPAAVVDEGTPPELGPPLLWDLDGQGVRSMHWSPEHSALLVIAGDRGDGGGFRLYRWSGDPQIPPSAAVPTPPFGAGMSPEALTGVPGSRRLLALSDDGDRRIRASSGDCQRGEHRKDGTCRNKDLVDPGRKSFRGFEFVL